MALLATSGSPDHTLTSSNQTSSFTFDLDFYNSTHAPTVEAFFSGDLLLHPFWERYRSTIEAIPDFVHYILGIFIAIVGMIGILGNVVVIYLFITVKNLRSPSNVFIINLAISDFGFSVINGFPLMTISCFMKKWYFGKLACELYGFLGGLFGFISINTLAWISYDRMFVIANPFEAMRKATMRRSGQQLLIVWAWALIWSVPPLLGWGAYIPEGFMTSCSFDYLTRDVMNMTYVWSMFACGFVWPVLMIIYCYTRIILAVAGQAKMMGKTAEKMGAQSDKDSRKRKQEIALAKVAAVTILFFMLSWLPYAIVAMGAMAGFESILTPYTCVIPVMFAKASAMWNPILYSLSHPKFRAALDEKFPFLLCCRGLCMAKEKDEETSNTAGTTKKAGRSKARLSRDNSYDSGESEVSEMSVSTTNTEATVGNKVNMAPNPGPRVQNGPSSGRQVNQVENQSVAAGPRERVRANYRVQETAVGQDMRNVRREVAEQRPAGFRQSVRHSLGKMAGSAYRNLVDAYVGLKVVSDRLGEKEDALRLQENHPASRRSSFSYENPTMNPGPPPSPGHHVTAPYQPAYVAPPYGVYSVPVVYQQAGMVQYATLPHQGAVGVVPGNEECQVGHHIQTEVAMPTGVPPLIVTPSPSTVPAPNPATVPAPTQVALTPPPDPAPPPAPEATPVPAAPSPAPSPPTVSISPATSAPPSSQASPAHSESSSNPPDVPGAPEPKAPEPPAPSAEPPSEDSKRTMEDPTPAPLAATSEPPLPPPPPEAAENDEEGLV